MLLGDSFDIVAYASIAGGGKWSGMLGPSLQGIIGLNASVFNIPFLL